MELLLEALLHAQLADVICAFVIDLLFFWPIFNLLFLALIDAPDVAHHMAGQLAVGILAEQPRLDVHAREAEALSCKPRHLLIREARADRQGFEALGLIKQLFKAPLVTRMNVHHS